MAEPQPFTLNPSLADVAWWREANRQLRPPSPLQEIGIHRTADRKFGVGPDRFGTLAEAIVEARLEQTRRETWGP
jgi:hypothetical protein